MASTNIDRRRRILDAAGRLVIRYGYDKTTVSDIAKEAGISKGAIYLHYTSKEALMHALLMDEVMQLLDALLMRLEQDTVHSGTFHGLYSATFAVMMSRPLMRALITTDKRLLGDFVRVMRGTPLYDGMRVYSADMIKAMQDHGLLRTDLTPQMLMYFLGSIRYAMLTADQVFDEGDIPPIEEIAAVLPDVIQRAFGTTGSETGREFILNMTRQTRQIVETLMSGDYELNYRDQQSE